MPVWSETQDRKTWMLSEISFRGVVMFLAGMAIFVSEMRFSWMELLMGRYLAVTNIHRPESGNVWEQGRLKQMATQTLEQIVDRQLTARREARESASLSQLIHGLPASQGTIISAAQFRSLYGQLHEAAAETLFSPILILRISAEKKWDRVYIERDDGKVGIYLLDNGNNVLSYTTITDQQIESPGTEMSTLAASLDDEPEFAGRIYPASRFFMALDSLPDEVKRGAMPNPTALLSTDGTPVRVGISDEVHADTIRIGVEMDTSQGHRVVLITGQEWAVWQVRRLLEPRTPKPSSKDKQWFGPGGDP